MVKHPTSKRGIRVAVNLIGMASRATGLPLLISLGNHDSSRETGDSFKQYFRGKGISGNEYLLSAGCSLLYGQRRPSGRRSITRSVPPGMRASEKR